MTATECRTGNLVSMMGKVHRQQAALDGLFSLMFSVCRHVDVASFFCQAILPGPAT